MEDRINRDSPDYDAGYQEGWEKAIYYVIDISKEMRYTDRFKGPTLEELEQRIV